MAEIAFVVKVSGYGQASLGTFIEQGRQLCQLIEKDLPLGDPRTVKLLQVLKSDSHLVPDVYAVASENQQPTSARPGRATDTTTVVAGGSAGDITVTGVKTTDRLISCNGIKDADQTVVDFLSGANPFTITATDTINNTGGTASTGYHLVVVYERT